MDRMSQLKKEEVRRKRMQAERRRRQKILRHIISNIQRIAMVGAAVLCAIFVICAGIWLFQKISKAQKNSGKDIVKETEIDTQGTEILPTEEEYEPIMVGDVEFIGGYTAQATEDTVKIKKSNKDVVSKYAILIDESTNTIVARKKATTVISPASMTKILTILVAAENIEDMDGTVKITREVTDYAYTNNCSVVGYEIDEEVPVKDLFYGTILPSGADAAVALAEYTAGSHEAFVDLMNAKLDELGLAETAHFTNCVGIYNEEHHCTVYDMAMILKAALANDFCREVLSAHTYTTAVTKQHPEGIPLSNWFLRRIEDKESGGMTQSGKTGYVDQSGSCAASYFISDSGTPYICVTVNSESSWRCIYDHVAIYSTYTK